MAERTGDQPSARESELLDAAYRYVLEHGMSGLTLRPLAAAIGSSPRVLLYLFGSRELLIRAILARARRDELVFLGDMESLDTDDRLDMFHMARTLWSWLSVPQRRPMLALWVEAYGNSVSDPDGPWADFAHTTVTDWLAVLQSERSDRNFPDSQSTATSVLAVIRGALLDLLATGDADRVTRAVDAALTALDASCRSVDDAASTVRGRH